MRSTLLFLIAATLAAAAGPLSLVQNGKSSYSIVLSRDASPSELRAAAELRRFLGEMSGADLPVSTDARPVRGNLILVGRSQITDRLRLNIPFDQLGPEGFALKTAGRHLVIAGGRQRGTMYGVYTFLEKLGCRWVASDASRIPSLPTITVAPLDETQKPAFEYREVYLGEAFDKDWAARNKTNGQSARLDASTGGKIQYFPFVHSFYSLVPPAKYFKDHPEYFSLLDGKRRGEQAQLCLTNPDVLRITIETVRRWLTEHPEATICSVSQNDYWGQCECDSCRRVEQEEGGAASGPVVRFVNAVAEAIEKDYPGKLIDTLAYFYTETPPSKTRPRHNVRIRLCPIGACNAHPYEKCPHNAYIIRNLKAWSRMTNNIYVWHYNANFSHFLLPVPDFDELAADVPMYKRSGVVGLFMQGSFAPGGSDGALRAYVISRLLWDTKADVGKAVSEFYDIYFGKAAPPLRAYLDQVHKLVRPAPEGEGQHWWCCRAPEFSDGGLAHARELFRQALAAADTSAIRHRVRIAELSLRYLELRRQQTFAVRDGVYAPVGLDTLRASFPAFMADVRQLGVTRFGEEAELHKDEQTFASSLKTYPVVTLENAALRLSIVPALNARVVRMIDKRTGRELLDLSNSLEVAYPDRRGLAVSVHSDYVNAPPYPVQWTAEPLRDPREITFTGATADGLKLRRTMRLAGDAARLETLTTVENASAKPIASVIQSELDADAGRMEDAAVEFTSRDGSTVRRPMIVPEQQPVGTEAYLGPKAPAGQWRIVNSSSGLVLANRFTGDQVDRTVLNWSAKNASRVSLRVWSNRKLLQPEETQHLDAGFELR
jgi:hypothetical protein